MEYALVAVLGVVCITAVTALAPKVGVASPLILVALGTGVSLLPFVPPIEVHPEWVLGGILPPLLYSAAVSMPTMDFRRDFSTIGGLSVSLVLLSSLTLGAFFAWAVPGLGLPLGIALGAIVSPTDAVATSIVKRAGVSPRLVTVLEGESLLNDATALVLLRSATAAVAVSVSLVGVAVEFVAAVVVAAAIGLLVGILNLRIRARVNEPTINTAISFVVPFLAYLPTEHVGASGLVATVTAGLVTGQGAAHHLRPQDRIAEALNWRTVELLLEGAIFLIMGLELYALVEEVHLEHQSLGRSLALGAAGLIGTLLIRALYVVPLLASLSRRQRRAEELRDRLTDVQRRLDQRLDQGQIAGAPRGLPERLATRLRRKVADVEYVAGARMGRREGLVLVWAGMRGAVTVAAAQSLDADIPQRSMLVLAAFVVAAGSLLIQGGTLAWLVGVLGLARDARSAEQLREEADEVRRLRGELALAAQAALDRSDGYDPHVVQRLRRDLSVTVGEDAGTAADVDAQYRRLRIEVIRAQREALLLARALGTYSSAVLGQALLVLDADELRLDLRELH